MIQRDEGGDNTSDEDEHPPHRAVVLMRNLATNNVLAGNRMGMNRAVTALSEQLHTSTSNIRVTIRNYLEGTVPRGLSADDMNVFAALVNQCLQQHQEARENRNRRVKAKAAQTRQRLEHIRAAREAPVRRGRMAETLEHIVESERIHEEEEQAFRQDVEMQLVRITESL